MKKILICLIFLFSLSGFLYAQEENSFSDEELFQQAIKYYSSNDYYGTIKNYNTLLYRGMKNATIYYNLALAYIKINEYGRAALNIERALRLSPRDSKIRKLRKEFSKIIKEPPENIAEKIISQLKLIGSLNELTAIVFVLFILFGIFIILYCFYYKKIYLKISIISLLCCILVFSLLYMKIESELISKEAVIVSSAYVRNNPIKNEEPSFELIAGKKVQIISELGRWRNIKSERDGFSGWIDKSLLELI